MDKIESMNKPIFEGDKEKKAFAKGIPSAFIVASPFQLLCAIEAIHEFAIDDYRIAFILERNKLRNNQMYAMAAHYHLPYDEYWMGEFFCDYYSKTGDFAHTEKQRYERIFIGDYYPTMYNMLAAAYAAPNAVMLYMDDGNSTILCINGVSNMYKPDNWRKMLNWYRNRITGKRNIIKDLANRGIYDTNCIYTIYSNILTHRFKLYPNTLSYVKSISQNKKSQRQEIILVVGIAVAAYAAETIHVSESLAEAILWNKLSELRKSHPNDKIIYVPHNRDENLYVPQICKILDIEYTKIEEPIEVYMLKSIYTPREIFGFGSSALVVFRQLYPSAAVITWNVKNPYQRQDKIDRTLDRYYKKAGIKEELIWLPKQEHNKWHDLKNNMSSLMRLIYDKLTGYKHAEKQA